MVNCNQCGKGFKSRRALGGHMSTAHARGDGGEAHTQASVVVAAEQAEPGGPAGPDGNHHQPVVAEEAAVPEPETQDGSPVGQEPVVVVAAEEQIDKAETQDGFPVGEEPVVAVVAEEEIDKAESIRRLLVQGFSPRQIKEQFSYARQTVDDVAAGLFKPENPPLLAEGGDGLPVVRKLGGGVEIITPEALLRRYMGGNDEAEFRVIMKYRAMQLMVMDDVAIMKGQAEAHARLMEPILKLMKETREEQDAAAARARASVEEAARGAAGEALGRAMPYIDERLKDVEAAVARRDTAAAGNPMQEMMARTMGTLFNQVAKSLGLGGEPQQQGMPGFTHETVKRGGDAISNVKPEPT